MELKTLTNAAESKDAILELCITDTSIIIIGGFDYFNIDFLSLHERIRSIGLNFLPPWAQIDWKKRKEKFKMKDFSKVFIIFLQCEIKSNHFRRLISGKSPTVSPGYV